MKRMITVALASMMLLTFSTAMAASPSVNFDGSVLTQYRWDDAGANSLTGGKIFLRLNANAQISDDVSLYTRFAAEGLTGDKIGNDFDKGYYSNSSATTIDRWGIIIKGKDFTYKVGRQDGALGQGLIYDSTGYMGINEAALDGLIAWGKSGDTNLTFVVTKVWAASGPTLPAYAIDASSSPAKGWKWGGTLARLGGDVDTNYWAINTAYTDGKATFGGEYGQSNNASQNKGYALSVNHSFDNKNSAYLIYSRVEANASMAGFTAYDSNGKGIYYGLDHKITKDSTISLFYKDMKTVDTGEKSTSLRTTFTYKF
ncbi:MAG: hypothetical protein H6Q75_1369 [Firmicutes bacterium]|nr:hypothetical protein [Bacillota bacterium]